jgi:hypothetical protein
MSLLESNIVSVYIQSLGLDVNDLICDFPTSRGFLDRGWCQPLHLDQHYLCWKQVRVSYYTPSDLELMGVVSVFVLIALDRSILEQRAWDFSSLLEILQA